MHGRLAASLICSFGALGEGALMAQDDATPAQAPTATEGGGIISYPPEFFVEYQPSMALDMITRVPGFTYNKGDTAVRGLAGAGGNILIDGQRPSTKSLNLDDILRRIPVANVARIDIIRGGAPGIDMQGQSIVANIIRRSGATTSLAAELMTKFYTDDTPPARIARIEGARAGSALSLEGVLHWRQDKDQTVAGIGRLTRRDGSGTPTSWGRFEADWDRFVVGGNGAAEYRSGPDFLRLSLSGERDRQDRDDISNLHDRSGAAIDEIVATDFSSDEGAVSAEYERTMSSRLTLRLMALESRERDRTVSTSTGTGVHQISNQKALSGESIVRTSGSYLPTETLTIDGRIERTFNFLDAESSLVRGGVPVPLPSANIRVEEKRIDAEAAARLQLGKGATLEAALGFETSTIAVEGDADRSRSLDFLKPRLNLTFAPALNWEVRLRAERIVSQLDFEDFASSASLDTGTVNAGNPDLTPEQSWLFESAIERRFWGRGALTLTLSHSELSDVIDLVPIEDRFDAPGNIGSGIRQEARLSGTVPLDRLGLKGTLIRFNATARRSRVTDPVTLERRRISYQRPFQGDLTVIKELPQLRSVITADFYAGYRETSYRINEVRVDHASTDPLMKVSWNWTVKPGTSLLFLFENIAFRSRGRDRTLFDGPRSTGQVIGTERRNAVMDPFFLIRLRKDL